VNALAHIEINVSDLKISKEFYGNFLAHLKWTKTLETENVVGFKGADNTHVFLVQTELAFGARLFHRKHAGLNHVAFRVESKEEVDEFSRFLKKNSIQALYADDPKDYAQEYNMEQYFAVFFEDPDRIKLEVVFMQ
jgi:catechol 2,3-dioxygenase-like lactoylglutathione lyase family enzyme